MTETDKECCIAVNNDGVSEQIGVSLQSSIRECKSHKYKALKQGVGHEPYRDSYIFQRDGWVCGICGRKINKKLKHPNPLSKSINHIIPLSKGGNDSPVNVQAAHLRCNMGKHNINTGQLRLIG